MLFVDKARAEAQNVGVVVLARGPHDVEVAAVVLGGARALDLVGAHRLALARAAYRDAKSARVRDHLLGQRLDVVGVVVFGLKHHRAPINRLVPQRARILQKNFFELKPRMVACNIYFHTYGLAKTWS